MNKFLQDLSLWWISCGLTTARFCDATGGSMGNSNLTKSAEISLERSTIVWLAEWHCWTGLVIMRTKSHGRCFPYIKPSVQICHWPDAKVISLKKKLYRLLWCLILSPTESFFLRFCQAENKDIKNALNYWTFVQGIHLWMVLPENIQNIGISTQ